MAGLLWALIVVLFVLWLAGFLVVHIALAVLVPKTLVAMTVGRASSVPPRKLGVLR